MPIQQPSGSIKLTNVSLVRMKKGKKRFEIACYRNKVQDWRKGVEKDIDEVLQIPQVFLNVSKGQIASNEELKTAFGITDHSEIILQILNKGELQVGSKERQAQSDQFRAEILDLVVSKCINPTNQRQYPVSIIEKTLKEIQFTTSANKPAKTQALDAIRQLVAKQIIPIARARMKVRCNIAIPSKEIKKTGLVEKVKNLIDEIDDEDMQQNGWELIGFIDPGNLRKIDSLFQEESKGKGTVEVLDMAVVEQGEIQW